MLINVYETLTRFAPLGSEDTLEPGLATSWTVSDDGMTWTFKLRKGVKFHDGADFDASAVKRSIERTKQIGQCAAYLFEPVSEIQTPDPHTVVFKLAYPAPLDAILASPYSAWIMSPGAADKDAAWFAAGNEAGTGPYRFARYEPGQRLVVQRFDDYWRGWQPGQFDTVVFEMLDDNVAAEQMLRAGELDFANQFVLTPDQMASLDGYGGLRLDAAPSVGNWVIFLNHRRPPPTTCVCGRRWPTASPIDQSSPTPCLAKERWPMAPYPPVCGAMTLNLRAMSKTWIRRRACWHRLATRRAGTDLLLRPYGADAGRALASQPGQDRRHAQAGARRFSHPMGRGQERTGKRPRGLPTRLVAGRGRSVFLPFQHVSLRGTAAVEPGFYSDPAFDALVDQARRQSAVDQTAASTQYVDAQRMLADDAAAIYALELPELNVIAGDIQGFVTNLPTRIWPIWYDLRREK